ncbi:MAG: hypothetical protein ACE5G0_22000 [Rhodothermales bacterium]
MRKRLSLLLLLLAMFLLSCEPDAAPEQAPEVAATPLIQAEVGYVQELSWAPDGASLLLSILELADTPDGFTYRVHRLSLDSLALVPLTPGPLDYWTSWSPDGARIAFASRSGGNADIFVMAPDGTNRVRLTTDAADDTQPAWSPDGARIAFVSRREGTDQIYVMNADGSGQSRVGEAEGEAQTPAWSPDGRRIAFFETASDGTDAVYLMNADGTGRRRIATGVWPSWSPDGSHLLFGAPDGLTAIGLDDGVERLLVEGEAEFGAYAPDGTRVAYIATEEGRVTVYVMKADGTAREALLSRPAPAW